MGLLTFTIKISSSSFHQLTKRPTYQSKTSATLHKRTKRIQVSRHYHPEKWHLPQSHRECALWMFEAAESFTDADWYNLECCQNAASSHLLSPCSLSVRLWYGSTFFSSAFSFDKLNKIQVDALRLCTRAMKSTPSLCLLHYCHELPLHIKHKARLLTFLHTTLPLISDS